MSSESFIMMQTLLLVVVVSWAKAGLAEWSNAFIAAVIVMGLIGAPLLRRRETGGDPAIPWKASIPILAFAVINVIGYLNPSFDKPSKGFAYAEKEELKLLIKREFGLGGNPNFLARVQREMDLFRRATERGDHDKAIFRLMLAHRYVSEKNKTSLKPVFDRYLEDMKADSSPWLPSVVTKQTAWIMLYPFGHQKTGDKLTLILEKQIELMDKVEFAGKNLNGSSELQAEQLGLQKALAEVVAGETPSESVKGASDAMEEAVERLATENQSSALPLQRAAINELKNAISEQPTFKVFIHQSHLLALVFLQGIWVCAYLKNRRSMRRFLGALATNCVLLAAAGIYQSLAYDYHPDNIRPEIWGTWEAPERYFFSSFTYKNHWCAYAVLGLSMLAGLIVHWLRRHPHGLLRGSPMPLALLGMVVLVASAVLSESVLGILLILVIGLPFACFFCQHFLPRDWGWRRVPISCSLGLFLPLVTVWAVVESDSELKRATLQKVSERWQSISEGRTPWRYYHSADSWAMFSDRPIWGWGLDSTPVLYPHYVSGEVRTDTEILFEYAHHDERFLGLLHSHNDWFQYLAETGVVGVVLLALTPLLALRRRRLSSSMTLWTLLACGALALYSFVEFPSRTPAFSILFAVTLGCSLKYALPSANGHKF